METSALSFAGSPADARTAAKKRRLIAAAAVGNALEFYDFTVYSFFAILIGKLFFPVHSSFGQLMLAVASFGVGFVTRPLGGLVIGMYADRAGRKKAMILTLLLMALGTLTIAVAPTFAQVGIAAPLLLVLARLLQGFASGGEVGASTTLLLEQAPQHRRGFYASFQFSSQGLAALAGALTWRRFLREVTVFEYERGLYYIEGRFREILPPGRYRWFNRRTTIQKADMRVQTVAVTGQEVLSADAITLKVSIAAQYEISDPLVALTRSSVSGPFRRPGARARHRRGSPPGRG